MQIVIEIPEKTVNEIKDNAMFAGTIPSEILWDVTSAIVNGIPLPKGNKCKWIHYDYRTICPEEHDINNPYWMIPENRIDALRYCPYCGKEIEIDADIS